MKKLLIPILFALIFAPLFASAKAAAPSLERLFYYTDTDSSYASLKANASKIDIISPQAFTFDATGTLQGGVSDRATQVIDAHSNIKLMPLVENADFDLPTAHAVVSDPAVGNKLISDLVNVGLQNHYWGWQLDMEHMNASDRPLFTAFAQKLGNALHAANLEYSIAVVAKVSDDPKDFSEYSWNKWAGVFDYAPLAAASDFLSIMLYDQDDSVGPATSLPWYTKVLDYATSIVSKEKLSVGIPFYAWEWIPGDTEKVSTHTYQYVLDQIKAKTVTGTMHYDTLGTNIMSYTVKVNGAKEKRVLWYENIYSFQQKYDLLKKYGVRGFSAWAMGQEDARIWTVLPKR